MAPRACGFSSSSPRRPINQRLRLRLSGNCQAGLCFFRGCARGSENVAERTAKARQHVLTIQLVVRSHGRNGPVCPIDPAVNPELFEDAADALSRANPFPHLFLLLTAPYPWR